MPQLEKYIFFFLKRKSVQYVGSATVSKRYENSTEKGS